MSFGLLIVGDEILSGKREDKHLAKFIEMLSDRGLTLKWAHYVGDDREAITEFLRRSMNSNDIVFSTGGIGATPDDHTRQAAAAAAEVPIRRHPEAVRLITERANEMAAQKGLPTPVDMNSDENRQRLAMADFPLGCEIVPNPFNKIPGFSVGQHYFVPGFPVMAWPMIEWVLDTKYRHLFHQGQESERSIIVFDVYEAQLTPLMESIERQHQGIKVFSLPSVGDDKVPRHIELGVKGQSERVDEAYRDLISGLQRFSPRFGAELRR
ncbi:MAG TPA: molybdopterin-binding protein [Burkholderiaceae bacterium]|nr:molybdopterin-binding protein [Burkholderiaceae bacterium]